jgi:hypothetical protein
MSHKTKKYGHASVENAVLRKEQHEEPAEQETMNQDSGMFNRLVEGAQETASRAVKTVNSHRTIIALIGAGSAAAIFLLATERGQTVIGRIKQLTADGYDALSRYAVNRWDQLKESVPGTPSMEDASEKSEMDEKIHQLQEKFKRPAA